MQPIRTYQPTLLLFKTIYTGVHCCRQLRPRSVISDLHKHLPTVHFSITLPSISCSSKVCLELCLQRTGGNRVGTQHLHRADFLNQAGTGRGSHFTILCRCALCVKLLLQFCSSVQCTVLPALWLVTNLCISPLPCIYVYYLYTILRPNIDSFLKNEGFPCFFLSCKANARV